MQEISGVVDDDREEGSCGQPNISIFKSRYEALDKETRQLMRCFLSEYAGLMKPRCKESQALSTLKRVVANLLEKHRYTYNGMYCFA